MRNILSRPGREPGARRRSLRAELLFNLAFLAAAALLLAVWTAGALQHSAASSSASVVFLVLLIGADVLILVGLGDYLLKRLVLQPLAETVAAAEAIAEGDYERRVRAGQTQEIDALSASLNRLTDELLRNQSKLADNVISLDQANQRLHEAQRELVQAEKMASIGRLGAGVAHEIGNPLGALLGYASLLRRRGAHAELVDGIEREARRIDQIVRGLLDYARPAPARREPVDVNASVGRVLELLREQGRLGGVELRLELAPELPSVPAVAHRVDQMFVNLFSNAIAAMRGSGRLTVVTRRERYAPIREAPVRRTDDPPGVNYSHLRRQRHGSTRDSNRLLADRDVVRIIVADSGPGIPRELIDSVFEPFVTTKPPGEGTGLGLAIVASTVAEIGGRIDLSSAEGAGATFHLYLPAAEDAS